MLIALSPNCTDSTQIKCWRFFYQGKYFGITVQVPACIISGSIMFTSIEFILFIVNLLYIYIVRNIRMGGGGGGRKLNVN